MDSPGQFISYVTTMDVSVYPIEIPGPELGYLEGSLYGPDKGDQTNPFHDFMMFSAPLVMGQFDLF